MVTHGAAEEPKQHFSSVDKPSIDGSPHPQGDRDPEKNHEAPPPKAAPSGPPPGPNGGLHAWLQVAGGFMLFSNTFGILNTFGIFQTFYESGQLFHASSSDISWIGSLQSFLLLLTCFLSGPIFDRGQLRLLLVLGSFLVVFGWMMLSLCHTYWEALLAQGFVVGIGAGCLFIPAVAILPTYFTTRVGTAIGIAASGSSLGGIIYPIVFYRLLPRIGFPWAVRVMGFMALGTQIIPVAVLRQRVKPPKARALIDWTAFEDLPYMIFVGGGILGFAGLYVGLFYISYYGQATGYTDESLSFYLVPVLNAASIIGRTLPNILADKIGPFNVIMPGAAILSVVTFCLLAVQNAGGLIVLTLFFGFFSGVFIALPPVCFVSLTSDKTRIGTRIGMGNAMIGLGVLVGGPGGGGILQRNLSHLDWTGTWAFAGALTVACALVFLSLRIMRVGLKIAKC